MTNTANTINSKIDWSEIARRGLLIRINQEIMHPLGLAIYYHTETGNSPGATGEWSYDDTEPDQPMEWGSPTDWKLPCDVTVGHITMRKGVKLSMLIFRMKLLYKLATGLYADEVANRSPEDRRAIFEASPLGRIARETAQAEPATPAAEPVSLKPGDVRPIVIGGTLCEDGRWWCEGPECFVDPEDCEIVHGATKAKASPTAGMNIAQRILHVGGRNNTAGYVEFGSIQAVDALVRQVLRDIGSAENLSAARGRAKVLRNLLQGALPHLEAYKHNVLGDITTNDGLYEELVSLYEDCCSAIGDYDRELAQEIHSTNGGAA